MSRLTKVIFDEDKIVGGYVYPNDILYKTDTEGNIIFSYLDELMSESEWSYWVEFHNRLDNALTKDNIFFHSELPELNDLLKKTPTSNELVSRIDDNHRKLNVFNINPP